MSQTSLDKYWKNSVSPARIRAKLTPTQSSSVRNIKDSKVIAKTKLSSSKNLLVSKKDQLNANTTQLSQPTNQPPTTKIPNRNEKVRTPRKLSSTNHQEVSNQDQHNANQAQVSQPPIARVVKETRKVRENKKLSPIDHQNDSSQDQPTANQAQLSRPLNQPPTPTGISPLPKPTNPTNQQSNPPQIPPKTKLGRRLSSAILDKFESMLGGNTKQVIQPTTTHREATPQPNRSQPTQVVQPSAQIPPPNHPPPTPTHSATGARPKNNLGLRKTKNNLSISTPSPIRKKGGKNKKGEIVTNNTTEGRKLSVTLMKWLEIEKNGLKNDCDGISADNRSTSNC